MRRKKHYKFWSSLYVLIPAILLVGLVGYKSQVAEAKSLEAARVNQIVAQLQQENTVLAVQAKQSKTVWLSEEQIEKLLKVLMPKEKDRKRFMAILKCENGTHDPKRVNINKPGLGYDLGIAQINSRFHSDRVKEFFGQEFDEAMQDPVKNLVYATYLYQNSGFNPWVCNKLAQK